MALRKRIISLKINKAIERHSAMVSIDNHYGKTINYDGELNPLTEKDISNQIEICNKLIEEYNNILGAADKKSKELNNAEEILSDMYTRVLAGSKSIFGVDSNEVKELGGTKKSERKHFKKSH